MVNLAADDNDDVDASAAIAQDFTSFYTSVIRLICRDVVAGRQMGGEGHTSGLTDISFMGDGQMDGPHSLRCRTMPFFR